MIRSATVVILIMAIWSNCPAVCEEEAAYLQGLASSNNDRSGFTVPAELAKGARMVEQMIQEKNEFEFMKDTRPSVTYNDDGTINKISYSDGTLVSYSYRRDSDGAITACIMETESWALEIVSSQDEITTTDGAIVVRDDDMAAILYRKEAMPAGDYGNDEGSFSRFLDDDGTNGDAIVSTMPISGQRDNSQDKVADDGLPMVPAPNDKINPARGKPVITIYLKNGVDLDELSHKPAKFDFKEIGKIMSKVVELKNGAISDYKVSTKRYYDVLENELIVRGMLPDNARQKDQVERRAAVDDAVGVSYAKYRQDENDMALRELLLLDRLLRRDILIPAQMILDSRMAQAGEYVLKIVDQIIESNLSVYMTLGKDEKIEAIVNLQDSPE